MASRDKILLYIFGILFLIANFVSYYRVTEWWFALCRPFFRRLFHHKCCHRIHPNDHHPVKCSFWGKRSKFCKLEVQRCRHHFRFSHSKFKRCFEISVSPFAVTTNRARISNESINEIRRDFWNISNFFLFLLPG